MVGVGLLAGCLPVPLPPHDLGPAPDRAAASALQVGGSTRADVLLTLGEPRYRIEGDRFLMYEWDVAYGYLVIGGPQAAYPVPVVAPHYLCFEFGADGRLVRRSTLSGAIYGKADKAIGECMHPLGAPDAADGE